MKKSISYNILKLFNNLFTITFTIIFFNVILNNSKVTYTFNPIIVISTFLLVLFILLKIYKLILYNKNFLLNNEKLIVLIFFILIFIIQLVLGYKLRVTPSWDFGIVHNLASEYAITGKVLDPWYLGRYRNNIGLFIILASSYRIIHVIFGINQFIYIGMFLNIISINLSIFLSFKIIKKTIGIVNSIIFLLISLITIPLYTYIPIIYTDTLSITFPVIYLYIYIFHIKQKDNMDMKKIFMFIFMGIMFFLGSTIKLSVIIVMIAIFIDIFIHYKLKLSAISITIILTSFILTKLLFNFFIENSNIFNFSMYSKSDVTFKHWVMMGMGKNSNGWVGGFNDDDYNFTFNKYLSRDERDKANEEEIKNRLNNYGLVGYLKFLLEKATWTWGDGTYSTLDLIGNQYKSDSIDELFVRGGKYYNYFVYISQAIHITILFLIILSTFYISEDINFRYFSIMRISIFGLFLFLLIWETIPRYLFNFIPIFTMVSVSFDYMKLDNSIKKLFYRNLI